MNKNKIVEYVNENNVDIIIEAIRSKKDLDVHKVIQDLKKSRTEYGMKVQRVIEKLNKISNDT